MKLFNILLATILAIVMATSHATDGQEHPEPKFLRERQLCSGRGSRCSTSSSCCGGFICAPNFYGVKLCRTCIKERRKGCFKNADCCSGLRCVKRGGPRNRCLDRSKNRNLEFYDDEVEE